MRFDPETEKHIEPITPPSMPVRFIHKGASGDRELVLAVVTQSATVCGAGKYLSGYVRLQETGET